MFTEVRRRVPFWVPLLIVEVTAIGYGWLLLVGAP